MGITTTKVGRKASLLLIDPANSGHRGNYTCTVRNPAGMVNYTTSLYIHGMEAWVFLPRTFVSIKDLKIFLNLIFINTGSLDLIYHLYQMKISVRLTILHFYFHYSN